MSDNSYDAIYAAAYANFDYVRESAQSAIADLSAMASRPSVLMRPGIAIDGDKWCALYGENLQDGVAGFGDSPAEAMAAFDLAWNEKLARKAKP